MADTKITALAAISTIDVNPATSPIPIVDLLDNSMAASGTTKKVTVNQILGSGGTATLASATISGDLTVDTSVFKVNTTTDQVGIGTATPTSSTRLDVVGGTFARFNKGAANQYHLRIGNSAKDYGLYVDIDNNGTNGFALYDITAGVDTFRYVPGASGSWTHYINGTTAMTLNSTGLGVGRSPSAWNALYKGLVVGGTSGNTIVLAGNDASIGTGYYLSGAGIYNRDNGSATVSSINMYNRAFVFRTAASGAVDSAITWTDSMTLDASGNLLVGTTSTAGSASNATKTVGGLFSTINGATGSTATGVAATLFTAPNEAVFMVSAYIVGSSAPANYNAVAIVKVSGGTAAITTVSSALNLTISLSGLNVQATQTSGVNQAFAYSAIRIS